MKSYKSRMAENRCQGYGPDYVPFITSREARSIGTSSSIWDPIEGRSIQTLSTTESLFYYCLRWDSNVIHIREQYLLDNERMHYIADELGVPKGRYYTTDFLVDYSDGTQMAYSIKSDAGSFDSENRIYRGSTKHLEKLIMRQLMEKIYWETLGTSFSIVTSESINRNLAFNVRNAMSCYDEYRVTNKVQKFMYLIAHRCIEVTMDHERLNFQELADNAVFDIDSLYDKVILAKEGE